MPTIKGTHTHPATGKLLTYEVNYAEKPGVAIWDAAVFRSRRKPLVLPGGTISFQPPGTAANVSHVAAMAEIDALTAEQLDA
jgi:hypothetical protein